MRLPLEHDRTQLDKNNNKNKKEKKKHKNHCSPILNILSLIQSKCISKNNKLIFGQGFCEAVHDLLIYWYISKLN